MATTQALTIRIAADASGAISVISQTTAQVNQLGQSATRSNSGVASLSGGVQNLGRYSATSTSAMASLTGGVSGLSRSTLDAVNNANRLNQSLAENTRVTNAAKGSMDSLKTAALGLMSVLSGREIIKQMDAWASLEGRLKLVSSSMNELRTAQEGLSKIAQSTRTDLESTTNLYFKMAQATRDAGKSQQELLSLVETTNKAIIISGSGTVEAKNALIQFGQALASNRLGGDELRSMAEQTPRLVMAIRDGLGVTTAEFKRMAEAGSLTTQVVTDSLAKMAPRIEKEFSQMPLTIGQSFTLIGNALTEFIGKGGQTSGAAQGIAESMRFAAGHVTELANALGIAVGGFIAYKAAVIAAEIHTAILTKTMQLNPFVAVATAIGVAATALYEFKDATVTVGNQTASIGGIIKSVWNSVSFTISNAFNNLMGYINKAVAMYNSVKAFLGEKDMRGNPIVSTQSASSTSPFISALMTNGAAVDAQNKQATDALTANQDKFMKDLQPTTTDIAAKKVKESNDKRLAFDKLFADQHKKNVIEEQETLKAQTDALGRELNAQEKLMIHNTVFASEIRASESAAKKSARSSESTALSAAKKEQNEYNQLVEKFKGKDAFAAYNKEMSDLYRVQKSLTPDEFITNQKRIADEFLKNTVDLKAYNDELERHKKYLENVGDYNSTIDELTRNKQRGAISQSEYGLGVAKANAGLMNDASNAYPNAKIPNIPVEKAGEVIDAKNIDESAKALAKLNEQATKTIDSFNQLGDSGKMAFDGLLGGISAVASAASNFSDMMTKLNDSHNDYAKNYQAFIEDTTKSEADKASAKLAFEKENAAYQSKTFAAEISGARQVAGAASKMFGEKSAARKAFHAIEMGMSIIEMAMAAKKMVVDVAAGAANMFAQGGFAGFAGVAAMAAVMAGLGFAMSGGSSKTVDNTMPATKSTGTILGDDSAASNSVREIVDTLNDISDKEYPELKAISDGFRGVDNSMYKLNQLLTQSTGNFKSTQNIGVPLSPTGAKSVSPNGSVGMQVGGLAASTAMGAAGLGLAGGGLAASAATAVGMGTATSVGVGVGATGMMVGGAIIGLAGGLVLAGLQYGLGKLLGIGKTKITQLGEGIVINAGTMMTDGMINAVNAQTWRKDEQKVKGWFSDKKTIIETYGQLSGEIYDALNSNVSAIVQSSLILANELNLLDSIGYKFTDVSSIPMLKIDWFKEKLNGGDVGKLMSDQLNAWYDRIAENVFKNVLGEFQKMGEGMLQTAARVTIEMRVVKASYQKMGFDLGDASVGLAGFSDRLVEMYNSSTDAKDGLKNFIETMNDVYNITHTQGQKTQYTISEIKKGLTGETFKNVTGGNFDTSRMFDDAYIRKTLLTLTGKTAELAKSASEAETKEKELDVAVQNYRNPTPTTTPDEAAQGFVKSHASDWQRVTGVTDIQKASWETVFAAGYTSFFKDATNAAIISFRDNFLNEKDKIKAIGAAAGGGSKTLEQSKSDLAAAKVASETAATLAKESNDLTIMSQELLDKTIPTFTKIQDEYLKATMTSEKWLQVERSRIIDKELKGVEENMLDYANLGQITSAMITQGFEGITKESKITAEQMQRFVWSLEDAAKATKLLSDSSKHLIDFSRSIKTWVDTVRSTKIGTPTTQIDYAGKAFDAQLNIAKGIGSSAEEKRAALSGITGYADTFIESIKSYYGSSEAGMKMIEQVVSDVSGLEKAISIEQLQLGVLEQIKSGIYDLPTGLGPTFDSLVSQVAKDKAAYDTNPNIVNTLKLDADSKLVLSVVNAKSAGASDTVIDSFLSGKNWVKELDVIITDPKFSTGEKLSKIDEVFTGISTSFTTNSSDKINSAYDLLLTDLAAKPIDLVVKNETAKLNIGDVNAGLTGLNGISVDRIVDIQTSTAVTNVANLKTGFVEMGLEAANAIKLANDALSAADAAAKAAADAAVAALAAAAANQPDYTYGGNLEAQAVNAGYSGDYTDASAMKNYLSGNNAVADAVLKPSLFDKYKSESLTRDELSSNDLNKLLEFTNLDKLGVIIKTSDKYRVLGGMRDGSYAPVKGNISDLPLFAKGGIANQASIFGEAGVEAAVPLPDGRSIPVTLSRESANDNGETLAELKEQNKQLAEQNRNLSALIAVMQANLQESRKQTDSLDLVKTKIRVGERA